MDEKSPPDTGGIKLRGPHLVFLLTVVVTISILLTPDEHREHLVVVLGKAAAYVILPVSVIIRPNQFEKLKVSASNFLRKVLKAILKEDEKEKRG